MNKQLDDLSIKSKNAKEIDVYLFGLGLSEEHILNVLKQKYRNEKKINIFYLNPNTLSEEHQELLKSLDWTWLNMEEYSNFWKFLEILLKK